MVCVCVCLDMPRTHKSRKKWKTNSSIEHISMFIINETPKPMLFSFWNWQLFIEMQCVRLHCLVLCRVRKWLRANLFVIRCPVYSFAVVVVIVAIALFLLLFVEHAFLSRRQRLGTPLHLALHTHTIAHLNLNFIFNFSSDMCKSGKLKHDY